VKAHEFDRRFDEGEDVTPAPGDIRRNLASEGFRPLLRGARFLVGKAHLTTYPTLPYIVGMSSAFKPDPIGEITPDKKHRLPFGRLLSKVGLAEDVRFSVTWEKGAFVMRPVVSVPMEEAWLHRSPVALAMVKRGLEEMRSGNPGVDLGSFAEDAEKD
jgi:hypothetical protein